MLIQKKLEKQDMQGLLQAYQMRMEEDVSSVIIVELLCMESII